MIPVLAFLVLQCTLCLTIRVPIEWNNNSEVRKQQLTEQNEQPIETSPTEEVREQQKPLPNEYFEYTAKKPQFAAEIAAFHGVKSPQNHYKAYPIRPYTGVKKPDLGKHNIFDDKKHMFAPYRQFVKNTEHKGYVTPVTNNYNIYHPYKTEEPALKVIYQDPVLDKIRDDLINSKNRLQKYENDAGEPSIKKEEYLENPKEIDRKKLPHKNIPTQFEIHRPQRRPVYYVPPTTYNRDHILNKKIRHPWSQNYAKITPLHYRPIKQQLQRLRQQHAMKYDDEHNEYPQIQPSSELEEKPDGYDIYEKGREKFSQLRNNVDESINESIKENHPSTNQNLELQNTDSENESGDDDEEFAPVKNYAQVRKTETIRHLPRDAAYQDAETYDDLQNAPRLREAIKSSKAQTVYSEEGYEDTAYDHAGEQKHASDHEGHGGYLKQKEFSEGKYKIPSFSGNYEDAKGTSYRDNVVHGEKWKNKDKQNEDQKDLNDYSDGEGDYFLESDLHNDPSTDETNENARTENASKSDNLQNPNTQHDLNKREASFNIPEIDYSSTYLNEKDILSISRSKLQERKPNNNSSTKYPYYRKSDKTINKDSPLRYAENLNNIPRKTKGGTEFYDSRTQYVCPDVDDNVDPIPEKIKKGGHPDENSDKEKGDFGKMDDKPRLKDLGDKIDCFKAKYFGENPLDSPFFDEDLISNPEPVTEPILETFKLFKKNSNQSISPFSTLDAVQDISFTKKNEEDLSKNRTKDFLTEITNVQNHGLIKTDDLQPVTVRKKRATGFIYEPYKIIRDSQIQDSKKTTTSSNISPLIKQLQSSRIVEKVATNLNKEQPVKRNTGSITYKNIGKKDREKGQDLVKDEILNSTFIDVNEGSRQSEPRYEHRPINHKPLYTPVENKKAMSQEHFSNKTKDVNKNNSKSFINQTRHTRRQLPVGDRQFFDVTKYLPESLELQKPEPSNKVKKVIERKSEPKKTVSSESQESEDSDEEYDEYEDEEEEEVKTTTTTTTAKPLRRKRIRIMTTTKKPEIEDHIDDPVPKLRLITRFHHPIVTTQKPRRIDDVPAPSKKKLINEDNTSIPIYREKKKESSKSTLVTDTKRYEEGDDDLKQEDIDKLMGIKHDMEEYIPNYEKEEEKKAKSFEKHQILVDKKDDERNNKKQKNNEYLKNTENTEGDKDVDHNDDDDDNNYDGNDNDDNHDFDENDDNHDNGNNADNNGNDDNDDDEDDDDDDNDDFNIHDVNESTEDERIVTTPEPIKRTLPKTTDAPKTTTVGQKVKPLISKKKIETHQELPTKNSLNQFKQDIKELEIIKEIPKNNLHPNAEVLQLYKDENLAKEVNNIFDVEVFREDVDLERGPRHGGNYKEIEKDDSPNREHMPLDVSKKDTISSESGSAEITKLNSPRVRNKENIKLRNNVQHTRRNRGQRAKLEDTRYPSMHGGNLKAKDTSEKKNAKLIELSEDNADNEEETGNMHGGNFKTYGDTRNNGNNMHGGNYRSARITQPKESKKESSKKVNGRGESSKNMRRNSAALLDSFVRAVPILTTTPAYILDPSKRMYYYVDA